MTLHIHRSNRTEHLVDRLSTVLLGTAPQDPFAFRPLVVGSRAMERWLKRTLATTQDISAGLDYLFPRQRLQSAAHWLRNPGARANQPYWAAVEDEQSASWQPAALTFRVLSLIRARLDHEAFASIRAYLGETADQAPVTPRELGFAQEVADVVDRLMHDRPEDALSWARDPTRAPQEATWLAALLEALEVGTDPQSPALLHEALLALSTSAVALPSDMPPLCLFGLSTLGPGDRARLGAIARFIDVHAFILSPTEAWPDEASEAVDHPLLSALGSPSRDLHAWLQTLPTRDDTRFFSGPEQGEPQTTLRALQSSLLHPESAAKPSPPSAPDDSVAFHSCYGPQRQCEALRDELLALFDADPTLLPSDIAILTPDIETYAPLLAATLSVKDGDVPALPTAVSDLSLRATNAVADVLLTVLELTNARLGLSDLIRFISLDAVKKEWGVEDSTLGQMRSLLEGSAFRWGIDAANRAAVGQPALYQNTAQFALERLALGVLMPDPGGVDVLHCEDNDDRLVVPYDAVNFERPAEVASLIDIARRLFAALESAAAERSLLDWLNYLSEVLLVFCGSSEALAGERFTVESKLQSLREEVGPFAREPVSPNALLPWLTEAFDDLSRSAQPTGWGVTVSALEPMRSVPFRVIALVGMDDQAFPRSTLKRRWDPMATPLPGERDRAQKDRHLFLEALLSARDRFICLWSGNDERSGDPLAAATPVEELIDFLGETTGRPREALIQTHPLQPWSSSCFMEPRQSYSAQMAAAAQRLQLSKERQRAPLDLLHDERWHLNKPAATPRALPLERFAQELAEPTRFFLERRLGVQVDSGVSQLRDREPLTLDLLERYQIRRRWLSLLLEQSPSAFEPDSIFPEHFIERLAGEGSLPLGAAGAAIVRDECALADEIVAALNAVAGDVKGPKSYSVLTSAGLRLDMTVPRIVEKEGERLFQWWTPSKDSNEKALLTSWLSLLVATAAGEAPTAAQLVGKDSKPQAPTAKKEAAIAGKVLTLSLTQEEALHTLDDLVALWLQGQSRPLPLFSKLSPALAEVTVKDGGGVNLASQRRELKQTIEKKWVGTKKQFGETSTRWVEQYLFDYDPVAALDAEDPLSLIQLAHRLWAPVLHAVEAGQRQATTWAVEELA